MRKSHSRSISIRFNSSISTLRNCRPHVRAWTVFAAGVGFVKAGNVRTERWTLAAAGDRLYASRADEDNRASAVGKEIVGSRTVTYAPK